MKLVASSVVSSEGSPRGGSASKLIYVVVGRIQFLVGYWDKGSVLCWLLASSLSSLSHGPFHKAAHCMAASFLRANK